MSQKEAIKRKFDNKVGKVMTEMKEGKLKSSSGQDVTSHAQAVAIALSEARRATGVKNYPKK